MNKKERLDNFLVSKGYFDTKSQAQGNILAGKVKINGEVLTKAGTQINPDKVENIEIQSMPYVSRGGFKLEKALKEFNINLTGKICLDAGASTGGFTDCMLQSGAGKVYAVDVGYGQIAWKLRNDPKVEVIERTNIRTITPEEIYKEENGKKSEFAEFCTMDLSFISIIKVLKNIKNLMNPEKHEIIALIKPQFEAGKDQVPKSGVIRDKNIHVNVIQNIIDFACTINLSPVNLYENEFDFQKIGEAEFSENRHSRFALTYSPIQGPAGNIEYLIHLKKSNPEQVCNSQELEKSVIKTVEKAHEHFNPNKI